MEMVLEANETPTTLILRGFTKPNRITKYSTYVKYLAG